MFVVKIEFAPECENDFTCHYMVDEATLNKLMDIELYIESGCCGQTQCVICKLGGVHVFYIDHTEVTDEIKVIVNWFVDKNLIDLEDIMDEVNADAAARHNPQILDKINKKIAIVEGALAQAESMEDYYLLFIEQIEKNGWQHAMDDAEYDTIGDILDAWCKCVRNLENIADGEKQKLKELEEVFETDIYKYKPLPMPGIPNGRQLRR